MDPAVDPDRPGSPAEMLLALYFFAIYSLNREHALSGMADYLPLMPIFFALSLLTNRWCRSPRSRIAYRLSPLAAVPFLWADVGGWVTRSPIRSR